MLPRRKDIAKRQREAEDPDRCPKHLSYIRRTYVCAAWKSGECEGPMEVHHPNLPALAFRNGEHLDADNHGIGRKCSDFDAVTLCHHHHIGELHNIGVVAFEAKHGISLLSEGRKLLSPYKPRNWGES